MTAVERFLKAVDGTLEERQEIQKTYSKRQLKRADRMMRRINKAKRRARLLKIQRDA